MKTIANALARKAVIGERIELPWSKLNRALRLHTRELALIAGAPGSGKSVFAINLAMRTQLPVLYLAQDSAPSVLSRMAALTLGRTIEDVQETLRDPDEKENLLHQLCDVWPNKFIHAGTIDHAGIALRLQALTEILGKAPPLVIIDNLNDTTVPGHHHEEAGFYASLLNELKQMALTYDTCIIGLHHVTRRGGESGASVHGMGTKRIRMIDLRWAGEREAEHVIGIYHGTSQERMMVQILKQRDGVADPEGGAEVSLLWSPTLGRLDPR